MKTDTIKRTQDYDENELPKSLRKNNYNNNQHGGKRYKNNKKKKKKKFKILKRILMVLFVLIILGLIFIFLFFKTNLFQYYKELWVQTAMTTMNHQYLATWFLSEEEINEIMKSLEVENKENSELHVVDTVQEEIKKKENEINVEKIKGSTYVGYVMTVSDCSKVKMVDSRKKGIGTKLSEICKKNDAIAGINASGFDDPNGNGYGNIFNEPVIINKQLLYGNKNTPMNLIGFSKSGELILGSYTYQKAIDVGIESGLQFGPFLIVNGNNQIKKSNAGGLHPRMAIGQKKDGTFIFVCIDGRQPGYSIGATLLELQNIFERYGAYNAANLDGGSSATMYYNGKVINKTSTPIGERYLPDAIIVTK
ncbi:MAG: phosphodiester glycosidase family protein [Clostridia bacterium]|nr:phosphodiester glycosidase family protein [Clostridia bacterium]